MNVKLGWGTSTMEIDSEEMPNSFTIYRALPEQVSLQPPKLRAPAASSATLDHRLQQLHKLKSLEGASFASCRWSFSETTRPPERLSMSFHHFLDSIYKYWFATLDHFWPSGFVMPLPLRLSGVMFTAEFFCSGILGGVKLVGFRPLKFSALSASKPIAMFFFWSNIFLPSGKVMHSFCE